MSNDIRELINIIKNSLYLTGDKDDEAEMTKAQELELAKRISKLLAKDDVRNELRRINEWKYDEGIVHDIVAFGCDVILEKLLDAGANPNAFVVGKNKNGEDVKVPPIFYAILKNKMPSLKLLIQYGADENMKAVRGG